MARPSKIKHKCRVYKCMGEICTGITGAPKDMTRSSRGLSKQLQTCVEILKVEDLCIWKTVVSGGEWGGEQFQEEDACKSEWCQEGTLHFWNCTSLLELHTLPFLSQRQFGTQFHISAEASQITSRCLITKGKIVNMLGKSHFTMNLQTSCCDSWQ